MSTIGPKNPIQAITQLQSIIESKSTDYTSKKTLKNIKELLAVIGNNGQQTAIPAGDSNKTELTEAPIESGSPRGSDVAVSSGPSTKGLDLEPESTKDSDVTPSESAGSAPAGIAGL